MPASKTHVFVVSTAHSNIPATSQSDQKLSKNQPTVQHAMIVKLPAKHSASNPSQVKALNDESPTIVTPIMTVRLDGAGEQTLSVPPGEMAAQSSSLTGGYKGIALAKPPLVTEITIRMPKFKSLIHQGSLAKAEDLIDPVQETPTNRNKGA